MKKARVIDQKVFPTVKYTFDNLLFFRFFKVKICPSKANKSAQTVLNFLSESILFAKVARKCRIA